jgi:uncharacterized membrane protein
MILLDIVTFLGRLHPLVVHFPIGFLLLALVFQVLSGFNNFQSLKPAVSITLLLGFVAAVLACDFGYLLALNGAYDNEILNLHKITGIILACFSGLLYFATTSVFQRRIKIPARLFSLLMLCLCSLLAFSAHQGASLTHGNDYISMRVLMEKKRPKPLSVEEAYVFEDIVQPILNSKCLQCHRDGKLKGKLSVENLPALVKGGKAGPAVVPGKLDESELYKRISLDSDHEDFMPADGKTPLTKNETEIIAWWIEKANAVDGMQVAEIKGKEKIHQQMAKYLNLSPTSETIADIDQQYNPDIPMSVEMSTIESLRKKGVMVRIMLQKPAMLDVSLHAQTGTSLSGVKKELLAVSKNIVWLNLAANNLKSEELDFLKDLTNVEKVRLEKNPLDDRVVDHLLNLKHLNAVNLSETLITSNGLQKLKGNPSIKRVYNWNSTSQ